MPYQIRGAYQFNLIQFRDPNNNQPVFADGRGQTIAIVDFYHDPNIFSDVNSFSDDYNLGRFNSGGNSPSFQVMDQNGGTNYPANDPSGELAFETTVDVEWAHAIAPGANILLVEANDGNLQDGMRAVQTAASQPGVSVVSISWGWPVVSGDDFAYNADFQKAGVTFIAASGDDGSSTVNYPSASPDVLAVGGTALMLNSSGYFYGSETAWSGSTGGLNYDADLPAYQQGVVSSDYTHRAVPDVAYNAAQSTPYIIHDTYPINGQVPGDIDAWGTSAGAPQWAALIALADQGRALSGLAPLTGYSETLPMLYHLPSADFHDITTGANQANAAGPGYDVVTGLGSPIAERVVHDLVPPQVTAWVDLGTEGQNKSFALATMSNVDPYANYTATVDWGDGSTTAGTLTANANGGFDVGGNHSYAAEGSKNIQVTITSPGLSPISVQTTLVIFDAPLTVSPQPFSTTEGIPFHGMVATFTDANPGAPVQDFSAIINWGDNTQSPATAIVPDPTNPGVFDVIGDHTYAEELPNGLATITVNDKAGPQSRASVTIGIGDAPLQADPISISLREGTPFSGVVASFIDTDPGATAADFTATIRWDNNPRQPPTPVQITYNNSTGKFEVSASHDYQASEEGQTFPVSVTILDMDGGAEVTTTGQVQVVEAPLTASPVAIQATEGQPFQGLVASFTDSDPYCTLADYTAAIDWGDGRTSPGTITANPVGGFNVSGGHAYAGEEGATFPVSVTITDGGGATVTATDLAQVLDAPLTAARVPIQATEGQPFQGLVATFTDSDPNGTLGDYNATVDWGEGQTSPATLTAKAGGGFNVSGNHTYAEEGVYRIRVIINDVGGSSVMASDGLQAQAASVSVPGPMALAAADFNGDGHTDLVVAESPGFSERLAVLLGNGDGTFRSGGTLTFPGTGPVSVAVADFNHDGKADLVVTAAGTSNPATQGYTGGNVSVWFGNGDGTFRPGPSFPDNLGPLAVGAGDINGDGNPDIVVADAAGSLNVLLGDGTGAFQYSAAYHVGNLHPFALAVGDLNKDSKADVVEVDRGVYNPSTHSYDNGKVNVLLSSGGGLQPVWSMPTRDVTDLTDPGQVSVALLDFNGDGTLDLALAKERKNSLAVLLGNADGTFSRSWATGTIDRPTALTAGDFNEDGKTDLAVASSGNNTVTVCVNSLTTVADAPAMGSTAPVVAAAHVPFSGVVATFHDADPHGSAGQYRATLFWGDGTPPDTTSAVISADAYGGFQITGTHTYANGGSYPITVQIADQDGGADSGNVLVTLTPAAPPPAGLTAVASAFTHSAEFYGNFVIAAYQRYLGRTPAAPEVGGWITLMQQGLSDERLEAGFIGSQEYIADHGGSGAGWVTGMYQDLLGRTPAQAEVDSWVRALANGMSPTQVAYGFAASAERESQRVTADYQKYVGRTPSSAEVAGWVRNFLNGASNEDVIAGFVGSLEYFQRHDSNVQEWLLASYQDILSRQPSPAELQGWLSYL
jgi:hypothetical protein